MKLDTGKRALESYKIFPYIAWALTIGFTFFVYNLALELRDVTMNLQQQTQYLADTINVQSPSAEEAATQPAE